MKKKNYGFITTLLAIMLVFSFITCSGSSGKTFTDVGKVEDWLANQKGGASPDDPIKFSVRQNLQNMASLESNWHKLLTSINTAGLYVSLDLSGSTMPTTEFNADGGITTGKNFIVSLVLPDSTESVAGVLLAHFKNLKNAKSKNFEYIIGGPGPAGGFVFYDKGKYFDNWRYLEAAPTDMETRLRWVAESYGDNWRNFPNVAGTAEEIGTGKRNTELILAVDANAPAAKACAELNVNGFNDWFLPSLDELNFMYQNIRRNNIGCFINDLYWSSSYWYDSDCPLNMDFDDGTDGGIIGSHRNFVRAVRAF